MDINKLLKEVDKRIEHYSTTASDIIESAQCVQTHKADPYEAQKILIKGMKVQELAAEYMKLAAQLHCISLAHKAAQKVGYE